MRKNMAADFLAGAHIGRVGLLKSILARWPKTCKRGMVSVSVTSKETPRTLFKGSEMSMEKPQHPTKVSHSITYPVPSVVRLRLSAIGSKRDIWYRVRLGPTQYKYKHFMQLQAYWPRMETDRATIRARVVTEMSAWVPMSIFA